MDVVTGATGFLGSVLSRELARSGRRVRALTRGGTVPGSVGDVEVVLADLRDVTALRRAFRGADRVFHTAGLVGFGRGGRRELYEVNCRGTRNVLDACRREGVRRLVHVSSIEAMDLLGRRTITESAGFDPARTVLYYGRTKAIATRWVLEAAEAGMDTVAVCPTGYIGPYDHRLSALGRLVSDFARRRLPAGVGGGFDFVDIRDVARGTILAAERGRRGHAYILSGRYAAVREIFSLLEERTGVPAPVLIFPSWLALPLAAVAELWYTAAGLSPRFTRGSVRLLSLGVRVSSEKARRELGYAPRPLETTLDDTLEWLRSVGRLPGGAGSRGSRERWPWSRADSPETGRGTRPGGTGLSAPGWPR